MTERDAVAIVGVATTPFRPLYETRNVHRSAYDLAAEATVAAIEDAGIEKDEIDGMIVARLGSYVRMADMLGIRRPKWCHLLEGAGRMSAVAVQIAAAAIEAGHAETIVLIYGNNGRSAGAKYGGDGGPSPTGVYDTAFGMTSPGAYVAMMYQRYRELYGAHDLALAPLAINNRKNAMLNPGAVMQTPLTPEIYAESRYIAEPLRLYDYCLINDGAVAMVVTTTKRAKAMGRPFVTLSSTASTGDLTNFYTSPDFFYESCQAVANKVYSDAGINQRDVKSAQIYDNFTPTILFSLEGFGFCPPGEAWKWVEDGRIELGGELPINTSGGHTSESYMQGWAMHVEAVRQLRGEAGARQVPDCDVVQYICASPIVASHILRRG